MLLKHHNGLFYLQFTNLAEHAGVWHGIFTRAGGFSPAPFASLNVSLGVGDDGGNVARNRRRILETCGGRELVFADQVHGAGVLALNAGSGAGGRAETPGALEGDALITDSVGRALVIKVADCQAVLLYDPVRHVIANIHSGWRGSIQNIIGRTVEAMKDGFGSPPRTLLAGIGPSLGDCCAEFVNYRAEIPRALWKYRVDGVHFDFWRLSRDQLCAAGLRPENIRTSCTCTRCNTGRFFSYRAEGVTGRFAAVIVLRAPAAAGSGAL